MKCFVYKSLKKEELYLYLAKEDDFSVIPDSLLNSFGHLELVMALDITPERKLARADVNKVLISLQEDGFFVQIPPVRVPDILVTKNNKLH